MSVLILLIISIKQIENFGEQTYMEEVVLKPTWSLSIPYKKSLPDNPYARTHVIRWANVNFPKDGTYY